MLLFDYKDGDFIHTVSDSMAMDFDGWGFCLMTAENCLSATRAYTSVNETLDVARDLI